MPINRAVLRREPIKITVDDKKCINCGKCLETCPSARFLGFSSLIENDARHVCIECFACAAICPQNAIRISDFVPSSSVGDIPSSDEVLNLIKTRRTTRSFKQQKVKPGDWDKLLEAVKYSPTGHNIQKIDTIIIESPEKLKKISAIGMGVMKKCSNFLNRPLLRALFIRMMGEHSYMILSKASSHYEQQKKMVEKGESPILFNAPGMMLLIGPKHEMMSQVEANMAAQTVALYAPTLGLGTCFSGVLMVAFNWPGWSTEKLIQLPRGYKVHNVLLVGYPKSRHRYIPYRKDRNVWHL